VQKLLYVAMFSVIVAVCGQSDVRALATTNTANPLQKSVKTPQRLSQARQSICANMAFRGMNGILHQGKLMLNRNGNGLMQVDFFNAVTNRPESIVQTMTVQNSPYGILIVGSNPVYTGTRTRHTTYHPDNFLMKPQANGDYLFFAFDGQGSQSAVDISDC
jgi:hypothetical protein